MTVAPPITPSSASHSVTPADPATIDSLYQQALVHYKKGEKQRSLDVSKQVLELQPDHAGALLQAGMIYNDYKKYSLSKPYLLQVTELERKNHRAWAHLGKACVDGEDFEEGIAYFQIAFKLARKTSYARGLAKGYRKAGRHTYARNVLHQVLEADPNDKDSQFSLALSLFHLEDFPQALKYHEARLDIGEMTGFRALRKEVFAIPAYNGEDLSNKSLLLFTEQGFGDNLQFARYINLIRPRVKKLYLLCREGLAPLFTHNFNLDGVTDVIGEAPQADFRLPLLSIPHFFDEELHYLDNQKPYLTAPPTTTKQRQQLNISRQKDRLNVGIVWGAEPKGFDYNLKRVPLQKLAPLFDVEHVNWHALQLGHDHKELASFAHKNSIVDHADHIEHFGNTAQVIANMDLIISCDTSVAHLAGAMGKPVWVMLKMHPDWRWQSDGMQSRWYASSKLYRQYAQCEWSNVVMRIRADLMTNAQEKYNNAHQEEEVSQQPDAAQQQIIQQAYQASDKNNLKGAVSLLSQLIINEPANATAYNELGVIYYRHGKVQEAGRSFREAVKARPDFVRALTNMGACYNELGDNHNAIDCYEKVLAIDPTVIDCWGNMAKAYSDMEEFEMSVYAYKRGLAIKATAELQRGLAKSYRKSGRFDRSEALLRKSLTANPNDHDAHFGLSVTLFHLNRYPEAIVEFAWRRKVKEMVQPEKDLHPIFDGPEYNGQDLSNATLLIHTEQGFGDNLQFARFIHLLKPKVKHLVMWTRPGLGKLFKHCFELDAISENVFKLPPFDYHLPLLSIAKHFDPNVNAVDNIKPYISPVSHEPWPQRSNSALNIGLVWGASDSGFDHGNKRIPLSALKPLFDIDGTCWHSLQVGSDAEEITRENCQHQLIDHSARLTDFAETARLVSQLDLVISCDTSVAHLSGAMGKPTWLMLKKNPDWRWNSDGETSRWYPSARMFRQTSYGDWPPLIKRIAESLQQYMTSRLDH